MTGLVRTLVVTFLLAAFIVASAGSPTAFPETAAHARFGYAGTLVATLGVDVITPVPYVDGLLGGEIVLDTDGVRAGRVAATALIFPTVGTTPPLSVGLGADATLDRGGFAAHLGLVAGLDLLYVSRDLPAVLDVYAAPGIRGDGAFSFAWGFEARWYAGDLAWIVASSDLAPLALGVRFVF